MLTKPLFLVASLPCLLFSNLYVSNLNFFSLFKYLSKNIRSAGLITNPVPIELSSPLKENLAKIVLSVGLKNSS